MKRSFIGFISLALVLAAGRMLFAADEKNPDQAFINEVAIGGMTEVRLGEIAEKNATSKAVKEFGARMVADHGKANAELTALANKKNWKIPTALDAEHQKDVEKFDKLTGADFDREYVRDMIADHEKDIKSVREALKKISDAELKTWAESALVTMEAHLKNAQSISIGGPVGSINADATATMDVFSPKINAWAEGTVMSVESAGAKFSIRGVQHPYATQYAKMVREIHDSTVKLSGAERMAKEWEIRAKWADTLAKARNESVGKESTFAFQAVNKEGVMAYFDETDYYGRDAAKNQPAKSAENTLMTRAVKDLRVGDFVVVGYDAGIISNDAYVILKASKVSTADRK